MTDVTEMSRCVTDVTVRDVCHSVSQSVTYVTTCDAMLYEVRVRKTTHSEINYYSRQYNKIYYIELCLSLVSPKVISKRNEARRRSEF